MAYFSDDEVKSRQLILDHYESPDNKIKEDEASSLSDKYSSFNNKSVSCIDNLTLYLKIEEDVIIDAKFSGIGCAISTASTDIFCSMVKQKKLSEVIKLINDYFDMIEGNPFEKEVMLNLSAFKNISKQLNRIKCAKVGIVAIQNIVTK